MCGLAGKDPAAGAASPSLPVVTAQPVDRDAVDAVIALAFSADPVCRWLFPDPQHYWNRFPDLIRAFAGPAFAHGTCYALAAHRGASVWCPPGVHVDEEAVGAALERSVPPQRRDALSTAFEHLGRFHPTEPHWYLPTIAVDPLYHGRGYGSALLTHTLERCDRERRLAYLEATSPRNIALYERHGFELLATVPIGSAQFHPMFRQPR